MQRVATIQIRNPVEPRALEAFCGARSGTPECLRRTPPHAGQQWDYPGMWMPRRSNGIDMIEAEVGIAPSGVPEKQNGLETVPGCGGRAFQQ